VNDVQDARVLELTCRLAAPRAAVFDLLTEPSELAKWWGPAGFTIPQIDLDLRVGGSYRITMQPPQGEAFHLAGEFVEVDAPNRLAYTFRWEPPDRDDRETVARLSLTDRGDTTEVRLVQGDFATEARLALHHDGWTESFTKLQAVLA
jgi:uncharacterized protein YndB with AHSA1/START domain